MSSAGGWLTRLAKTRKPGAASAGPADLERRRGADCGPGEAGNGRHRGLLTRAALVQGSDSDPARRSRARLGKADPRRRLRPARP